MSSAEVSPPSLKSATPRAWLRPVLAAAVGGLVMFIVSQVSSRAGGTCMIMCNPMVAVPYGAIMGVLIGGFPRRPVDPQPR